MKPLLQVVGEMLGHEDMRWVIKVDGGADADPNRRYSFLKVWHVDGGESIEHDFDVGWVLLYPDLSY